MSDNNYTIRISRKDLNLQVTIDPSLADASHMHMETILRQAFNGAVGRFLEEEELREESSTEGR